jgi:predicted nucleic acid-binding Zn ribbon protein
VIRELGSETSQQHLCVCGSPLPKDVERGRVCSDCAMDSEPRETAAAINLRELGS